MSRADDLVVADPSVAVRLLRAGGLVAIPTETVYGLAADASNPSAVARIFAVKGRPTGHPLIVHVHDSAQLDHWASDVPAAARSLAAACWPGPLTVLVRRAAGVADVVTGGRDTVGVRVPAHPLTTSVLAAVGGLAAPSANLFGRVSPTTAEHVVADLGGLLVPGRDAVLDGGPCPVGVESTIVDCTTDPPQVLRAGGIPTEDVEALLLGHLGSPSGPSRTSGMLASHYAPRCTVVLAEHADEVAGLVAAHRAPGDRVVEVLDVTGDLVAYARDLYAVLRDADERGVDVVVARLPPPVGLGHAVRDRLMKAAAADPSGPSPGR